MSAAVQTGRDQDIKDHVPVTTWKHRDSGSFDDEPIGHQSPWHAMDSDGETHQVPAEGSRDRGVWSDDIPVPIRPPLLVESCTECVRLKTRIFELENVKIDLFEKIAELEDTLKDETNNVRRLSGDAWRYRNLIDEKGVMRQNLAWELHAKDDDMRQMRALDVSRCSALVDLKNAGIQKEAEHQAVIEVLAKEKEMLSAKLQEMTRRLITMLTDDANNHRAREAVRVNVEQSSQLLKEIKEMKK